MKDMFSPDSFIDYGFYFTIAAALQRRVWLGSERAPIFPNLYVILVGRPGIGKGLVIKQVNKILKHHKKEDKHEQKWLELDDKEVDDVKKMYTDRKPLMIPMAADSTTFEALVKSLAQSTRRVAYDKLDPKTNKVVKDYYTHNTICFSLEELSSLFQKNADKVTKYLLVGYDCGDYIYETKHHGTDIITDSCVNLFGGTTPAFMQESFDEKLIGDGFTSRTFYIFENQNRNSASFDLPEFSKEQLEAFDGLLKHVKDLNSLYGQCQYTPEAHEMMVKWWKEEQKQKRNTHPKLEAYYARKNMHVAKMAMIIHFSDNIADKNISVTDCETAIKALERIEKKMHLALTFGGKNFLAIVARKIVTILKTNGPKTQNELLFECIEDVNDMQFKEVIRYLQTTDQILYLKKTYLNKQGKMIEMLKYEVNPDSPYTEI